MIKTKHITPKRYKNTNRSHTSIMRECVFFPLDVHVNGILAHLKFFMLVTTTLSKTLLST